ncbi:MAG: GTPase ObgE, partial [Sulfurimonas sp.]
MVDIDSYKSTTEQIDTLKDEVQKFSQKLHEQRYAIVLTRADVLGEDELDSKIKEFLEYLGLSLSQDSSIKYAHYKQSSSEKELGFDIAKPYFVMALSSATHLNTKPLKNSLFELVSSSKADIL